MASYKKTETLTTEWPSGGRCACGQPRQPRSSVWRIHEELRWLSKNLGWLFVYKYIESRAETHERFYMIEVHRHRFEMSARKVPFEKCTHWRKVCGRSAKDQIGDSIYSFFYDFERKVRERRAKDARKTYPLEPCPAQEWAAFSHAWYWSKGKEAPYHNDILVASMHSCKQQPIYGIVCIRVCLIPWIDSWYEFLILENATLMGPRKEAKDLRKGVSWELLFSTTPIYIYTFFVVYWGHQTTIIFIERRNC